MDAATTLIVSTMCSVSVWSAVGSGRIHASTNEPATIPACPVTATLVSLAPGKAPKSSVAVPWAPIYAVKLLTVSVYVNSIESLVAKLITANHRDDHIVPAEDAEKRPHSLTARGAVAVIVPTERI